jgi:hypothetical protein
VIGDAACHGLPPSNTAFAELHPRGHLARHTALVLRSVPGMQQSVPSPEDDCCPPVTVPAMPVQIILRRSIAHGLKNRFAVRHR